MMKIRYKQFIKKIKPAQPADQAFLINSRIMIYLLNKTTKRKIIHCKTKKIQNKIQRNLKYLKNL